LGISQPGVGLIGWGLLQQRQLPLFGLGFPMLNVLYDLVIDFFLTVAVILATIIPVIIPVIITIWLAGLADT
jgi:hypothetical protein